MEAKVIRRTSLNLRAAIGLVLSDFILSFIWIWSGTLVKLFVSNILRIESKTQAEILKLSLSILRMFLLAWWGRISKGGSYNPLALLFYALSGNFSGFLFVVGLRIPAQVLGSITAVKFIRQSFPEIGQGPLLNVSIGRGALTEGLLTFTIVIITIWLSRNKTSGFFLKTWMSSMAKITLHMIGAGLTGACMNPASAMGWAYSRGDHITKAHLVVYWLAPIEATLLGAWIFRLLLKHQKQKQKTKLV